MAEEHIQMNLFDEEILHPNCTVQELRNTETGEVSFGWWENENPPKGVAKTHYDQVKAMTIEELVEIFANNDCGYCRIHDFCFAKGCAINCEDVWLDWLNTEVEE